MAPSGHQWRASSELITRCNSVAAHAGRARGGAAGARAGALQPLAGLLLLARRYIRPQRRWLLDAHELARACAVERLRQDGRLWWQDRGRDPSASQIRECEHLAQLAMHITEYLGYRAWALFDYLWAAAHPDLARGMLRAASSWDPFAP